MSDHLRLLTLTDTSNAVDFPLVVPRPTPEGFFHALVPRSRLNVILSWQAPGRGVLFLTLSRAIRADDDDWTRIVRENRELFTLGPGHPKGGQAVACWVGETAACLSGRRTLPELIDLAVTLEPLGHEHQDR
ncbi:hypothetical protein AMES_2824 [Amycolatopsis mediterranei S699]|uniref:Uncharacterized protein n=2 Tax=Amycolatopsis mediterranei TaxID=33910 RepID=A0A0H3D3A9_AMYMU|nr:hypothetical protein [Amycolatopsis mediterranei]ADJ44647.1 hypothetical protein AMED_2853 [Amycolatopsis mediterranei U32]AEK41387.1 hypothetical protein RAM_14495 [Amycolatopsis mediterranei S699]AFO76360.1 hypothetical protein AMES_2824 [Amycolatopsis mediterranei S699]AGT83489.1 hypothetical protein B737_2825 [Amycolatopsis mediterranei RB]KDO06995.1 hypothetical protein DV26_30045 [Amycolatopsis mediterranei]